VLVFAFDDHLDERAAAIQRLGFSPRQARFLVLALLHAGVFVERQYCAFARVRHGQKSTDFLHQLRRLDLAREIQPGAPHLGRLYHLHNKRLYRLVGEPDNRHRRRVPLARLVERLMVLDAVLDGQDGERKWLATERDKARYFEARLSDYQFEPRMLPHPVFRSGGRETLRLFPDKLPIAVDHGRDNYVFVYLVTRASPVDFRSFLRRHFRLWLLLSQWTLRVLVPPQFDRVIPAYREAARQELISPVSMSDTEELRWFFGERRRREAEASDTPDRRFDEAAQRFRAPRFSSLYRAWGRDGSEVLWNASSSGLMDGFESGSASLEFVAVTRPYMRLTRLVGTS